MNYKELARKITNGQENGHGEILYETCKGIAWYDYERSLNDDDRIFFRKPEYCTREYLEGMVYCDRDVQRYGVTPSVVADMLVSAYGDQLADMMCVLRNIIVFHYRSGMEDGIRAVSLEDMEDFEFDPDNVGQTWFRKQTVFICEGTIQKECIGMDKATGLYSTAYTDALGTTLVHETRHIMLDCNPFISAEDGEDSEQAVEDFCRYKWDMVRHKFHIPGVTVRQLKDIVYDWLNVARRFPNEHIIEEKAMCAFNEYRSAGGTQDMSCFKSTLDEYLLNGACGY